MNTREPATVQWRPRYLATPPLLEGTAHREGTAWGRGSVVGIGGASLRKTFA